MAINKTDIIYPLNTKPFRVRVSHTSQEMWQWCCKTFETGTWIQLLSLTSGSSFCFDREHDATMFALRWAGK